MRIVRITHLLVPTAIVGSILGIAQQPEEGASLGQESGPDRPEAVGEASELHDALHSKHYDEALAAMPLAQDIDMIEPRTGMTALGIAAKDESADAIDMVQPLLLLYGADPTVVDAKGYTPLHYAAAAGNLAVVQFLVKMGAAVDAVSRLTEAKFTPLAMAYRRGRSRIVQFLISHGAEDFESETKAQFQLEGALRVAEDRWSERSWVYRRGDDLQREYRSEVRAKNREYLKALSEIGRMDEAEAMQERTNRLLKVIQSTPAEPGMSRSDYRERVQANLMAEGTPKP